jgi:hypothetical protein
MVHEKLVKKILFTTSSKLNSPYAISEHRASMKQNQWTFFQFLPSFLSKYFPLFQIPPLSSSSSFSVFLFYVILENSNSNLTFLWQMNLSSVYDQSTQIFAV